MTSPFHRRAYAKILMIDDSAFEQCRVADMLLDLPYQLSLAGNGKIGYELALSDRPDLILLDRRMPVMDGDSCCRMLKANPATRDIPVIFLSGSDSPEERAQGLQIGAADFVSKPFYPGELLARIRIHLELARYQHTAPVEQAASACSDEVLVEAAKNHIASCLSDLPSLDDIARAVGTYREKLSDIFRQRTGQSVFEFARDCRINRSAQLLRETAMDVRDIATQVGFTSSANFATAFRAKTGSTPSAFRRSPG
ncbi:response regulator transcription factor [Massilia soli]|uniref:DNA-binding response regulator n=1 Tax=Massilia soli TaxID=2792854 RepID=A0ABS7SUC3_9BURK|nr:DNA-binding response regulator [Massilia soli]MBZ2209522.1 DNA-binding response regulator [Massilia soli]